MVWTLTLNPALDKTLTVENFAVDRVNRVGTVRQDAGGKGLNVARVVHRLGVPVVAVAPQGGESGRFLVQRLAAEEVPCLWHPVAAATRTNIKVVDLLAGTHTDLNEPGSPLSGDDLAALSDRLLAGVGPGDWVVFSGSVPRGVPPEVYGRWIGQARTAGAKTVLDADGPALSAGLAGCPDLVKPNLAELERWVGRSLTGDSDVLGAAEQMREVGAVTVVVSLGSQGAWLVSPQGRWFAPAVAVDVKSTVGAGDALVAGLVTAYSQGQDDGSALVLGMAAAAASVSEPGTGGATAEAVAALVPQVALVPA